MATRATNDKIYGSMAGDEVWIVVRNVNVQSRAKIPPTAPATKLDKAEIQTEEISIRGGPSRSSDAVLFCMRFFYELTPDYEQCANADNYIGNIEDSKVFERYEVYDRMVRETVIPVPQCPANHGCDSGALQDSQTFEPLEEISDQHDNQHSGHYEQCGSPHRQTESDAGILHVVENEHILEQGYGLRSPEIGFGQILGVLVEKYPNNYENDVREPAILKKKSLFLRK